MADVRFVFPAAGLPGAPRRTVDWPADHHGRCGQRQPAAHVIRTPGDRGAVRPVQLGLLRTGRRKGKIGGRLDRHHLFAAALHLCGNSTGDPEPFSNAG